MPSIYLVERKLLTKTVESNVHLRSSLSDQILQHFVPNASSTNQTLACTRYNATCKLTVFTKQFKYSKQVSINCGQRQSKTRKSKMLINCSEMTVNYTVMHCNTLHYTAEYTAVQTTKQDLKRPTQSPSNKDRCQDRWKIDSNYCADTGSKFTIISPDDFNPSIGTFQPADIQFRAWGASQNLYVVVMSKTTTENVNGTSIGMLTPGEITNLL